MPPNNFHETPPLKLLVLPSLLLALAVGHMPAAAPAATGSITGRVQNTDTGQYVNNARVTVRGTGLSILTDEIGTFRLPAVPAGEVILDIFYTGLDPLRVRLSLDPRDQGHVLIRTTARALLIDGKRKTPRQYSTL